MFGELLWRSDVIAVSPRLSLVDESSGSIRVNQGQCGDLKDTRAFTSSMWCPKESPKILQSLALQVLLSESSRPSIKGFANISIFQTISSNLVKPFQTLSNIMVFSRVPNHRAPFLRSQKLKPHQTLFNTLRSPSGIHGTPSIGGDR